MTKNKQPQVCQNLGYPSIENFVAELDASQSWMLLLLLGNGAEDSIHKHLKERWARMSEAEQSVAREVGTKKFWKYL